MLVKPFGAHAYAGIIVRVRGRAFVPGTGRI